MPRTILVYGAIAGLVIITCMIIGIVLAGGGHGGGLSSMLVGYLIMLVAFSAIFIAIKRHRDRQLGGVIKFPTALALGLGITLVASLVYVAVWEVYLYSTDYAFIGDYAAAIIAKQGASGASAAQLAATLAEMDRLKAQYANPLFRLPMTFVEVFPVGLLVTLVSAALLRNSKFMPASA
jgi:hypothetical protein